MGSGFKIFQGLIKIAPNHPQFYEKLKLIKTIRCITQKAHEHYKWKKVIQIKVEECNEPSCEALNFPYRVVLFNIFSTICI